MHNNNTTTANNNVKNNHHRHYYYNYSNFPPMPPSIGPRISFSNEFVDSQAGGGGGGRGSGAAATALPLRVPSCPEASLLSDFEFLVSNNNMMSADELFFKGRILPSFRGSKTTLREELLVELDGKEEEEEEEVLARPMTRGGGGSSALGRWKGLLGLKKVGKKDDSSNKCEGSGNRSFYNNSPQEMTNDGLVNKFK